MCKHGNDRHAVAVTGTCLDGRWLIQKGAKLQQERLWTGGPHSWWAVPVHAQRSNSIVCLTNRPKPQLASQQTCVKLRNLCARQDGIMLREVTLTCTSRASWNVAPSQTEPDGLRQPGPAESSSVSSIAPSSALLAPRDAKSVQLPEGSSSCMR